MNNLERVFADTTRAYHRYIHSAFESLGLHRGQPRLLHILWEGDGFTQKQLAQSLNITPATLTRMVQNLESKQLISRKTDEQDQRITRIYLTEKGKSIQKRFIEILDTTEKRIFKGFTKKERQIFEEMLKRVQQQLPVPAQHHPAG